MGMCTFTEEKFSNSAMVKGTTAFAQKPDSYLKDTGVYLPPAHSFTSDTVDVLLWFHGYYVSSAPDLIHPADPKMDMYFRKSVLDSGKDLIFVAPWLGYKDMSSGSMGLGPLGEGKGVQDYLEAVLDGIVELQKTLTKQTTTSSLSLGSLIIAGHSAGGAQMREASKHLGAFKDNLKECWGFDCFYDDSYSAWLRDNPKPDKYFYIGNGSGSFGYYAFKWMKEIYGTPRKPMPDGRGAPNTYLAPAVDRIFTAKDNVAFQSIPDIKDWSPSGPNVYQQVRKETDPFLDDSDQSRYWSKLLPKLSGHFDTVRNLVGPRITQSSSL